MMETATSSKEYSNGITKTSKEMIQQEIPPNIKGLNFNIPPDTKVPIPYMLMIKALEMFHGISPVIENASNIKIVKKNPHHRYMMAISRWVI
jgi:hypothetical protein